MVLPQPTSSQSDSRILRALGRHEKRAAISERFRAAPCCLESGRALSADSHSSRGSSESCAPHRFELAQKATNGLLHLRCDLAHSAEEYDSRQYHPLLQPSPTTGVIDRTKVGTHANCTVFQFALISTLASLSHHVSQGHIREILVLSSTLGRRLSTYDPHLKPRFSRLKTAIGMPGTGGRAMDELPED